jgi:type IV fimbrial biogenesis protein FimT
MRNPLLESCRRSDGFTLVELMVTVVVAAILMAIAVPSFRAFMQNDQQWVQTNNLLLALNTARSDAIKSDLAAGAQVCTSNNGLACTGTPWNQGWIVLGADPANPGNPPKVLQAVGALPPGTTLTEWANNLAIPFRSNGALGPLANAEPVVAFRMCDIRGPTYARYLQVTLMGRVVTSPNVGKDLNGAALPCP